MPKFNIHIREASYKCFDKSKFPDSIKTKDYDIMSTGQHREEKHEKSTFHKVKFRNTKYEEFELKSALVSSEK